MGRVAMPEMFENAEIGLNHQNSFMNTVDVGL
jgi:hypothetical protein